MSIREIGDGTSIYNGITVDTPFEDSKEGVKVEDFLNLMIAQLTNQDFMNPVDDTQYVTQLAQFATMQSMQELTHYSQTNYVTGLVGKSVTVASLGLGGQVDKDTGIVTKVDLSGDEYTITVNGKQYKLSQIMQVADASTTVDQNELDVAQKMSPIVQNVGKDSVKIRWEHPISDADRQDDLRYDVYYTPADSGLDFTTIEGVKKGEIAGQNLSKTEVEFGNLEPGQTYYINIVVTNKAGEQSIYQRTMVNTKAA